MSPLSKSQNRRLASPKAATEALQNLVAGRDDAFILYRRFYSLWCENNAAL